MWVERCMALEHIALLETLTDADPLAANRHPTD